MRYYRRRDILLGGPLYGPGRTGEPKLLLSVIETQFSNSNNNQNVFKVP